MGLIRKYGFGGSLRMFVCLIYTKLNYPQAKIIRLPFDMRNKRNVRIGKNFIAGRSCRIEAYPIHDDKSICISIGNNVQINDFVHIASSESITIKDNVLIAGKVFITDLNHGNYSRHSAEQDPPESIPSERKLITKPVFIDEKVWIGESASILPGAKIGRCSIIGAMSLVNSEIPPYSIAIGCPARVVKTYDFNEKKWLPVSNAN